MNAFANIECWDDITDAISRMQTARAEHRVPILRALYRGEIAHLKIWRNGSASTFKRWAAAIQPLGLVLIGDDDHDLHTGILIAYCEVGIEYARLTGRSDVYQIALTRLRNAQDRIGDTRIASSIARLQRRMANVTTSLVDLDEPFLDTEE